MKLLTRGWKSELVGLAEAAKFDVLIVCPFIGSAALDVFGPARKNGITCRLITKLDKVDFWNKASDCAVLLKLAEWGVQIKSLQDLHAKLYMFDREQAVVTSANLSGGGLERNHEIGVLLENPTEVIEHAEGLWNALKPVVLTHLLAIHATVEAFRTRQDKDARRPEELTDESEKLSHFTNPSRIGLQMRMPLESASVESLVESARSESLEVSQIQEVWASDELLELTRTGHEIWQVIPGSNDRYEVSNLGRARSWNRKGDRTSGRAESPKILKCAPNSAGQMMIQMWLKGTRIMKLLHVAMCEAFIGPRPEGWLAGHYDSEEKHNTLLNVRWCSQTAKAADNIRTGRTEAFRRQTTVIDGVTHIRCTICSALKPETEFYRFNIRASVIKRQSACKECASRLTKERRPKHPMTCGLCRKDFLGRPKQLERFSRGGIVYCSPECRDNRGKRQRELVPPLGN